RVVDMLEELVIQTATTTERPEYLAIKRRAQPQRSGRRPYFGSIPDFGEEAEGYAISGTAPESPAAKGGLKGGDLIVQFGKSKIGSLDDFDLALRKFRPGDKVPVTVLRKGKRVTLNVTLTRPR
ncbi:MAG: PDZ domain-containing protein, partial [Planctomycetaceae bacterium]